MKPYLKEFSGVDYLLIHAETAEEKAILERFGLDGSPAEGNLRITNKLGTYLRFELPVIKTQLLEGAKPCLKCPAMVVFLHHHESGNPNCINAQPAANGNIRILPNGFYSMVTKKDPARAGEVLYTSHFSDCKSAKDFRQK